MSMRIILQEAGLDNVTDFYTNAFKMKKGEELYNYEAFVDTAKKKVIFKLYIQKKEKDVTP